MLNLKSSTFRTQDQQPITYYDSQKFTLPPIVMVHGFPFNHKMWTEQIELLQNDYRIITYDIRGFGESIGSDNFFTMEILANDFIALLDHLKLKTVTAIGLSMGGYVVLRAHDKAPERFIGLVLADTQATADSDEVKIKRSAAVELIKQKGLEQFADRIAKHVVANHDSIEKIRPMILSNPKEGVIGGHFALMTRTDTSKSLHKITVPTLILVGEKDFVTNTDASMCMHELIPLSVMKIIPHAGHVSNIDNPKEFNLALSEFLPRIYFQKRIGL